MSKIVLKGIPTFRILDYQKAIDFYIDGLGFNLDWEHRFGAKEPVYMQISRDGLTLHLSENKRFQAGVIAFVDCEALGKLYKDLIQRGSVKIAELEKTNWQTLQLEIEDPFGNMLRFNETLVD